VRPYRSGRGASAGSWFACLLVVLSAGPVAAVDGDSLGMSLAARLFAGEPHDVVLVDLIAYVGLDSGLHVYDISEPLAWLALGQIDLPSPALDLAVDGRYVYIAAGESGLLVIDVADPSDPLLVARVPTAGTDGVAVAGAVVYLAEADSTPGAVYGLRTVDISDPASPLPIAFLPLANGATDVAIDGALAYVALGSRREIAAHGLAVVSVSSPSAPSLIAFVDTGEPVHDVALMDGVAYLATGLPQSGELIAVDVSFPPVPSVVARVALADAGRGIDAVSTTVYVGAGAAGLITFDVTNPATPVRLDALPTGRDSCSVAARGDIALLGERASTRAAALATIDTAGGSLAPFDTRAFAPATDVVAEA